MKRPLVLVVDDTDASRYISARVLRAAQMEVIEAGTGELALRLVEERKPDLVVLDIKLPDVNGFEVCRRMRASPTHARIAVLHVSATYITPETELESQQSGGDIYLAQPVEARELVSVVRALLRMRELERDLLQSEERLRLATEAGEIGTWDINLASGEAVFDPQTQRLLGYPPQTQARSWDAWRNRIHRDDVAAVVEAFDTAKSGKSLFRKEHRVVLPGGELRWVAPYGRAHVEFGQSTRMIGVLADVSDRKRIEDEREGVLRLGQAALEEAGKVARLKDEFLATLSHELRTPISVLTNWLNVMRVAQPDPEELASGLEIMQRNARLMTKLINDLLDVSGIMSGKLVLDREPASVEMLLTSAIDNVRPSAEAKDITIVSECRALAGPALIDPNRLQQVFLNLLSNAIKFTPSGGRIDVRCRQVGTQIEITISDNGEGIAPAMLAVIFDRFRQADSSITRRYGGLGLGLPIVRHIVELHGGSVSAHSAGLGKGSTFTITLPFVPASIQRGPSTRPLSGPAEQGNRLRNLRILAVDDDADARDVLARLLLRERAVVKIAGTAQEALKAVESWRPDVYLLDLGMPGESGYDLLARLKSRLGDDVPAIALTGYAREEDAARALYAGFRAHVAKPYELDDLCRQIINVAHPARPASPAAPPRPPLRTS
jgi:signal transduction histidine kinase/ActR/RegA family two-component response regulator